jgi:hypothetical protein
MHRNTTRTTAVIGATMALVLAGTAAVAAHPGDRDDRGMQRGKAGIGAMGGGMMPGARGLGGMRGALEDFERREVTLQTADGVTIRRVEQGTVDSVAADSLTFSLASGEAVTVVVDDDTQAVAFEEQEVTTRRGWSRTRMAPTEVETADIEAGAEIVVWSDAEDGADFVASRIAIQPVEAEAEAEEAEAEAEEAEAADEAVAESVTSDAAATDA